MRNTCGFGVRAALLAIVMLFTAADAIAQASDVEAGLRMYRDGVTASGEPMTAIVAGDVPIVGTQFSCESCHGRSGMGAAEGAYVVPPVSAQFLFTESPQPKRPAYDEESLARVLREGVTPSGRVLPIELMPRYQLTDDDAAAMSAYLSTLSESNSPGVDDQAIHFAMVVTEGVDAQESDAVLGVFKAFADDINQQTRLESERWDRGYTPESRLPTVFREWDIVEWTLVGPADTWSAQLESYYQQQPIFAMLGGLGTGSWRPVSDFCERREIPCLFPGTDFPDGADDNFYTLYFSRGLFLEADLIAAHLAEQPVQRVVQVYCDPDLLPALAVFRQSMAEEGVEIEDMAFDCDDSSGSDRLMTAAASDDTALVLWLRTGEMQDLLQQLPAGRKYASSSLLGTERAASLSAEAGPVYLAHPFRLPGKSDSAMRRFELWAKTRDVAISHPRRQAEVFFTTLALKHSVKHMGRFFIRTYVLDMLDHAQNLVAYLPYYPRATLGPGQRFLNKGGYVLPFIDGQLEAENAEWILPW